MTTALISILLTVVVLGGAFYWMTAIKPVEPNTTKETTVVDPKTEPTTVETVANEKTFEGKGFSATYPAKYVADDKGLWTEETYESHINPPENCTTCQLPMVGIISVTTDKTLEQQIIQDLTLTGTSLKELAEKDAIKEYEEVKIGDKTFTKIVSYGMIETTSYYIKNLDLIVSFSIFFDTPSKEVVVLLEDMLATLKFE